MITPEAGQRVKVTQVIRTRNGEWQTAVVGKVISVLSRPTGSWHAHGKHDKLWLPRLLLQRDDGELADLVMDDETQVIVLAPVKD